MQNIYIAEVRRWLQVIILVGGVARILYCLIIMQMDNSEEISLKKRMRNTVVFVVIAEIFGSIIKIFTSYFS